MLIAVITPIFSFFFIWRPQRSFQGRRDSVMSMAAE